MEIDVFQINRSFIRGNGNSLAQDVIFISSGMMGTYNVKSYFRVETQLWLSLPICENW